MSDTTDSVNEAARLLAEPIHTDPLKELRAIVAARLQTKAVNRDRASAAGRRIVADCRQSDVETLEWVVEQIDALIAEMP